MELANEAPHAYIPFHLAVKSSQPRDYVIVDANLAFFLLMCKCLWKIFDKKVYFPREIGIKSVILQTKSIQDMIYSRMSAKVKGFAAGVIAAVCYGTNPLGTLPLYEEGIHTGSVLFYRYAIALLIFALMMVYRGESFRVKWGHAIRFLCLGSFFAFSSIALYLSFLYMEAGVASTLLFVYPIMTAVLMTTFFHEHVTWQTALSILMALLGVALLYRGDGGVVLDPTGFVLVMASSLLYAVYIVSVNRWQTDMSFLKFTFYVSLAGLLSILVFTWFSGENLQLLHGVKQWGCALQLALLPTVFSLFFMTISINAIGSTPAAIMGALEPVTAVFIGVLVFHESFTLRLAVGIALILVAVTLVVLRKKS